MHSRCSTASCLQWYQHLKLDAQADQHLDCASRSSDCASTQETRLCPAAALDCGACHHVSRSERAQAPTATAIDCTTHPPGEAGIRVDSVQSDGLTHEAKPTSPSQRVNETWPRFPTSLSPCWADRVHTSLTSKRAQLSSRKQCKRCDDCSNDALVDRTTASHSRVGDRARGPARIDHSIRNRI